MDKFLQSKKWNQCENLTLKNYKNFLTLDKNWTPIEQKIIKTQIGSLQEFNVQFN
jgi:hypothetical protein